ncbi:MAG: ATP-binding cassette domain-containing protein, partial [Myxococcota bacterium]
MGLKIKNVGVELGGTTILQNITFRANEGTLIGVLGPSGSGKSTLLHAMSGFRAATSGAVLYEHRNVAEHFEELKRTIGFVPQDDIVPTSLKVERVLGYAAELRLADIEPGERADRVEHVLRTLGLTERKHLRVSKLSG